MRVASGPDPPGSSRCVFERRRTSVSRVCLSVTLATPASSGSTDTPWLCQGRLPPISAPPETGCPQLHRPAATGRRRRSLTSTQSTSASRRTGGVTHPDCARASSEVDMMKGLWVDPRCAIASPGVRPHSRSGHSTSVFTDDLPPFRSRCCELAAALRHVTGFPGLGLLRRLRHAPDH